MVQVLLGIGSNIDQKKNVAQALKVLEANEQVTLVCHSRVYETVAIGSDGSTAAQPNFYNLAARLETGLEPPSLNAFLRSVEAKLGRVRSADKFAPRPIDLDILFYGPNPFVVAGYQFPDPAISKFPHLACPLAEIAPDWSIPTTQIKGHSQSKQTLRTVANQLLNAPETASQIVRIFELKE